MASAERAVDEILEPKGSLLSKILCIAAATLFYYFIDLVMWPRPCCRKSARRQGIAVLNANMLAVIVWKFSAAYLHSWTKGNPHTAEALENTPATEIPLILTAAYYIIDIPQGNFLDFLHHILSVIGIVGLLTEGTAANVGVTFAFLVEVATLVYIVRNFAVRLKSPCSLFLKILYPVVFILVRLVALLHLSYNIVNNDELPELPQGIATILFMCSFFYCCRMLGHINENPEPAFNRRSRSRTPRSCRALRIRSSKVK